MRRTAPFVIVALLLILLVGGRLCFSDGLLGSGGAETYGHAWVQWWHAQALPGWPDRPLGLLVDAPAWPVIDPLPTAFAALITRIGGIELGYNAWLLVGVGLAFGGGAVAARLQGGDPWTGGVTLALAPAFLGSMASGLTEDVAVGLAALGLALVGHADLRRAALAGLCLGLLSWCGLVLAWAAAVAAVVLGLVTVLRQPARARSVALSGVIALLLTAPAALLQGSRLSGSNHRSGQVMEQLEPLWRLNPWRGVDLLSFVAPGGVEIGDALVRWHPGYLGLVALVFALAAGWSRWWGILVGVLLCAPGPRLAWAGTPLGIDNPFAAILQWIPLGDLINHHGRLLLLGAVALSILASRGAMRLGARAPLVAGLVALEMVFLSPVPLPLPVADISPPEVLVLEGTERSPLDDLSPGALLVLPAAGPGIHFQRPLLDQRWHGRPLWLSPNRPGLTGAAGRTPTGRWLASLAFDDRRAAPPDRFALPMDIALLLVMEPYVEAVADVLGPPDVLSTDSAVWDVANRPGEISSPRD